METHLPDAPLQTSLSIKEAMNIPGVMGDPSRGWREDAGNEDLSSTQLAALSLFAAHRVGLKVKPRVCLP